MVITDLHGAEIQVVNLKLAVLQADDFRYYEMSGAENQAFNTERKAYWEDIYQKLIVLEEGQ